MGLKPDLAHRAAVSGLPGYQWAIRSWYVASGEWPPRALDSCGHGNWQQEGEWGMTHPKSPSSCFAHCHCCGPFLGCWLCALCWNLSQSWSHHCAGAEAAAPAQNASVAVAPAPILSWAWQQLEPSSEWWLNWTWLERAPQSASGQGQEVSLTHLL